jgi:capsule polysaccharide export protein KpsE/RkpR
MLEVQNQALIKIAQEREARIGNLERELQQAGQKLERLKAERGLEQHEVKLLKAEMERLTLEGEFYHKRVLALEQDIRVITDAAAKYSLWGQSLVRELGEIDPAGQREREFGIWSASH